MEAFIVYEPLWGNAARIASAELDQACEWGRELAATLAEV